jgi:SpoVK/Ycf46/Vps4 family AAA+-type ATPase
MDNKKDRSAAITSQIVVPKPPQSRAAKAIAEILESGRPLTYIRSFEEQRVARVLREVAAAMTAAAPLPVWTWTLTEGLHRNDDAAYHPGSESPRQALDFIAAHHGAAIFHLKDFHEPLRDSPDVRRRLRDIYESGAGQGKFVVISSAVRLIPEELDRTIVFYEMRPPDVVEMLEFVRQELTVAAAEGRGEVPNEEVLQQLARTLLGLTLDEARYALRRAQAAARDFGPEAMAALLEEKRLLVNRSGVIEFIAEGGNMGEIGGLDGLKKWLVERRKLFDLRDNLSSEIVPKGVLLMGIPGCGKSLSVKAIASYFNLPLYRIDMIEIFSGRHGKPESAFVAACRMMEDMAPAVLWFDEIERGVTSNESGGEQGRIFGFFLTWMQEKARGLFVAATANRINLLPPEMIRKGRFDEVFFVDLPLEEERTEIFKIHLARRGVDMSGLHLDQLTEFTIGWAGSEVEQCVVSAVTKARLADRQVTDEDLVGIAAKTVPLSRTMNEQINLIRAWAFERALRASPPPIGR